MRRLAWLGGDKITKVIVSSSLHAVSRYPALISSAFDMKALQMQFDGFMLVYNT